MVMDFVDVDLVKFVGFVKDLCWLISCMMVCEVWLLGVFECKVVVWVLVSLFVSEIEVVLFWVGGVKGCVLVVENGIDLMVFDLVGEYVVFLIKGLLIVFIG